MDNDIVIIMMDNDTVTACLALTCLRHIKSVSCESSVPEGSYQVLVIVIVISLVGNSWNHQGAPHLFQKLLCIYELQVQRKP